MSQKNATPTKAQAETLRRKGLDIHAWAVVREFPNSMIIRDRHTGEFRIIEK